MKYNTITNSVTSLSLNIENFQVYESVVPHRKSLNQHNMEQASDIDNNEIIGDAKGPSCDRYRVGGRAE